ncbi:MAG: hypothetical protein ACRDQA_04960 [Nocardioidaceae bacterium]
MNATTAASRCYPAAMAPVTDVGERFALGECSYLEPGTNVGELLLQVRRRCSLAVGPFFCQDGGMARKKTTVYIDEALLRTAKVTAARAGKREYEVFEDALREHLGLAGTVERIWAGISREEAPDEEEAARIAAEELAAARAERGTRKAS